MAEKRRKLIGHCPICDKELIVASLKCKNCDTEIKGEFALSPFNLLNTSQHEFALVFLKNAGNIKMIEKELNISYPTVKKNLDELLQALGIGDEKKPYLSRKDVLDSLKNGEISFEEAEKLLQEV